MLQQQGWHSCDTLNGLDSCLHGGCELQQCKAPTGNANAGVRRLEAEIGMLST